MIVDVRQQDACASMAAPPRAVYLHPDEAARVLGLHPETLRRLRRVGGGPPFFRIGTAVRYRLAAIKAWARSREVRSTADEASRGID